MKQSEVFGALQICTISGLSAINICYNSVLFVLREEIFST